MKDFQDFFRDAGVHTSPVKIPKWLRFRRMSSGKSLLVSLCFTLLLGLVLFYLQLPALNFQSEGFYFFLILLLAVFFFLRFLTRPSEASSPASLKKTLRLPVLLIGSVLALMILGWFSSLPLFNAKRYRNLLSVETGSFAQDVEEITYNQIPMLDKDSATMLGDRKMGELAEMVSQFEVADDYVQINYQNRPVRVTPLVYSNTFKWLTNRAKGLPAYVMVDMVTQEAEVVRLEEGMKYSTAEHFGQNVMRHLRFRYPTYLFDQPNFEIDDSGHPYWVCPRLEKKVGLFGGTDIKGAVLMDAVTGDMQYHPLGEIPQWVDRVLSGDLIMQQYDNHGKYINGYWNSLFGQKGVTMVTQGYNYIAIQDDVYVYTGITSVSSDSSNTGFILVNQRTKEAKYYAIPGATEYSAMASAEGMVQHLKYTATFPLLLNISGEPTYFMALKDNAKLVKMYALVNVEQYQIVATGTSVAECERSYIALLKENKIQTPGDTADELSVTNVIEDIRSAVLHGNTYYYLKLKGQEVYYSVAAASDERVVLLNAGQKVKIYYKESSTGIREVLSLELLTQ